MGFHDVIDNQGNSYKEGQNKAIITRNLCTKLAIDLVFVFPLVFPPT
jgi:hypothetical protein